MPHPITRAHLLCSASAVTAALLVTLIMLARTETSRAQQARARGDQPERGSSQPRTEGGPQTAQTQQGISGDFAIQQGDVLDVVVFDEPQLSCECTVGPSGTITLPLLKPMRAQGVTPPQLSEIISDNLRRSGLLSRPQVTVTVRSAPSRVVSVEGAVKNPLTIPIISPITLLSAISQAGGLTDDAGDTATIFRAASPVHDHAADVKVKPESVVVDLNKLTSAAEQNMEVLPGDRIVVERAGLFYVLGEVGRPGVYNLKSAREEVSILQALALAGDTTSMAKRTKAFVLRKDPSAQGGRAQINVDIKSILARKAPDRQLQADDILYVPTSGRKRVVRGMAQTTQAIIAPTTAGLIVYRR